MAGKGRSGVMQAWPILDTMRMRKETEMGEWNNKNVVDVKRAGDPGHL